MFGFDVSDAESGIDWIVDCGRRSLVICGSNYRNACRICQILSCMVLSFVLNMHECVNVYVYCKEIMCAYIHKYIPIQTDRQTATFTPRRDRETDRHTEIEMQRESERKIKLVKREKAANGIQSQSREAV